MAGFHGGAFNGMYQCSKCSANSQYKEVWGCQKRIQGSKPTFEYIDGSTYWRYWQCPFLFIPDSIFKFVKIYRFYKMFPSASFPSIENASWRFVSACQLYDSYLQEIESELLEKDIDHGRRSAIAGSKIR